MTYAELRTTLDANEHQHALDAVGNIRFRMLEGQLARALEARKEAERKLFEHVCTENDEMNRLRAENRRLYAENDALRQAVMLAGTAEPRLHSPIEPASPGAESRARPPKGASALLRNSNLVQRALRGDPLPEPPEPGTVDPTITEEDLRDHGF